MSSKPQLLIAGKVHFATEELKALESKYEVTQITSASRDAFIKDLAGPYAKAQALYINGGPGPWNSELISHFPDSLKFVGWHGAGYDPIDVDALSKKKIQLSHTPGAVDDGTATVAMFLIISSLRNFYSNQLRLHENKFKQASDPAVQNDVEEKVLGIVGMGGIGRALAKRALGFDMKIVYHNRKEADPKLLEGFPSGSIKYISSLDELLKMSDVVSLHVPLNSNTDKFFGKKQFDTMKKGACLINTARGGVVDEEALLAALESGQLGSAGLDVFPDEPNVNQKLIDNERLTLLPHMGTETRESRHRMEKTVIDNLVAGLDNGKVINLVPEQKDLF